MKKLILLVILAILLPSTASAVWWNPASWIKQKPVEVSPEVEVGVEVEKTEILKTEKPAPVQERVVEKVIQVTDPALQVQINNLIRENGELKAALAAQVSVVQQLNQCKADLSDLKVTKTSSTVSSEYADKKEKLEGLDDELSLIIDDVVENYETITVGKLRRARESANELIRAYKYMDSKTNLKEISEINGQGYRDRYKEAFVNLRRDLDWYVRYR